jgi:hypothetical protein
VSNSGTISAIYGIALNAGGSVTNRGKIDAASYGNGAQILGAGNLTNTQSGIIVGGKGVVTFGAADTVTNFGTIESTGTDTATSARAVFLASGGTVTNGGGGSSALIEGIYGVEIQGGSGSVTNMATILASTSTGIFLVGGGSVTNIANGPGPAIIEGTGSNTTGLLVQGGGNVANGSPGVASDIIEASRYGVWFFGNPGSVTNFGTIVSTGTAAQYAGVYLGQGGSVKNASANALIEGLNGVRAQGGSGTVTNFGVIDGVGRGVVLNGGGTLTNGGSGSSALIEGIYGVQIQGGAGSVTNMGTISASTGKGVFLVGGGGVTNQASGSGLAVIEGTANNSTGVLIESGGSVTNGASVSAAANIEGVEFGVWFFGSPGSVTNFGTITSTGTDPSAHTIGVYLGQGGGVTNSGANAVIEGLYGIQIQGGSGTITNSGVIDAVKIGAFLDGGGTLTNAGTITASNGAAVLFEGTGNRLVVDPGAVFQGTVDGGAGSTTLELAAGAVAGSLIGLGTSLVDFGTVIFDPGAAWTVEIPQGVVYTGAFFGGFALGDAIDLSGVGATSASYARGVLTLDKGTTPVAELVLSFGAGTVGVRLGPDGSGGTDVTALSISLWPTSTVTAMAMCCFATSSAGSCRSPR